ncbi:MAG: hypothetical protein OEW17_00860 [Gemmatimonadota bacterium]|nr:hypothetical protein [Gemmatimonadota bacterium]MDH4347331.1 hypothetical protein [Gemmatimonadota bacterium]MDH5283810.1 hypothetical protein [Gemmatimonadota bacterium]
MPRTRTSQNNKPYPDSWEQVADLRVFRASAEDWDRLATWRHDMTKRGWRLLKVTSDEIELIAVFGKAKLSRTPPRS